MGKIMALQVVFQGKRPIPSSAYSLWIYTVKGDVPSAIPVGQRIALAVPSNLDIQNPQKFPSVPELAGMFLQLDAGSTRQYVGRVVTAAGPQTLTLVAPTAEAPAETLLVTRATGQSWVAAPFTADGPSTPNIVQSVTAPAVASAAVPAHHGRPVTDFVGALPYASEMFGIYQPLAGWLGQQSSARALAAASSTGAVDAGDLPGSEAFAGEAARDLSAPVWRELLATPQLGPLLSPAVARAADASTTPAAVLSPVGLFNFFREYFFEFDTFLGVPAGHVWISPGGTVEVIEVSTRRTLVEKTVEQAEETSRKVEESITAQEDIADAVKEDNANDTKLGVSASGGGSVGVYHAEASASFSTDNTVKKSSENAHKHTRTQSSKVASEIKRNFKTTFRTATETTDTTSRRYVVQNTTDKLVNYELRRKMRKVGVQLQHIGTRLCWQVFLDDPGRDLGLGDLLHVVPAPDLSALHKPERPMPLEPKTTEFDSGYPLRKFAASNPDIQPNVTFYNHAQDSDEIVSTGNDMHAHAISKHTAPPPAAGYTLDSVAFVTARSAGAEVPFRVQDGVNGLKVTEATAGRFQVIADFFNSGDGHLLTLSFRLTWKPTADDPAQAQYLQDLQDYNEQVAEVQRQAWVNALRDRLVLASSMRPRPSEDLRSEERQTVYGTLIRKLELSPDPHLDSELIRQIFDVDEMLYFTAPDYWRPGTTADRPHAGATTVGHYPAPAGPVPPGSDQLYGQTMVSWYSRTDTENAIDPQLNPTREYRVDYLITEDTQPAPMGSSLGWLIELDGDERRNEFLNASWVKAVLPVRPGHEKDALRWLADAHVEGEAGLGQRYQMQPGDPASYQGLTLGQVLDLVADGLQSANTDMAGTLAAERVFEHGFDPLDGGFRPAEPFQVCDEWIEVLPTDQIVAVEVTYDPKTGEQV
jgi:hypothetical protein